MVRMIFVERGFRIAVAAALLVGGALCAGADEAGEPVAAPVLASAGYINGAMNIAVEYRAGTDYEVEMQAEGEEAWSRVAGVVDKFEKNSVVLSCWYRQTNYVGTAAFRIRAVVGDAASAWADCGAHKATLACIGTQIGRVGAAALNSAFDGRFASWIDATGDNGDDKWVGYLFDETVRIRALRFLPRLDHMKLYDRYRNSLFQSAGDASFSDAQTIYTVPGDFSDVSQVTEVAFDPPVSARAFRHWKSKGGYEQTAELEFISAEMPLKPALKVEVSDITNFYPVLFWSFPDARFACSTCRLERANAPEGPWTPVTAWLDPAADTLCVTNTEGVSVGQQLFYRVAAVTRHPDYAGEVVHSAPLPYTRMRRLDRSWDDEAHLYGGLSVMPFTNGLAHADLGKAFDGNAATFPDLYRETAWEKGPVGLDFGANVWVGGFGYVCRSDNTCYNRITLTTLYCASGDDVELRDKVACSDRITRASQDTTFYYQPTTACPEAGARCWFLFASSSGFCCNVAELAFFGWTQADLDQIPVLQPPVRLGFARDGRRLVLSWAASARATGYDVQRRLRGAAAWQTLAAGIAEPTYADEQDEAVETAAYEYRVVARNGEEETATSAVLSVFYYRLGDGTGLQGAVWWPYARETNGLDQTRNVVPLGVGVVDVARPADEDLVPGVASGARYVWDGSLICPADGTYTFDVESDDGALVRVGGVTAANAATANPSGNITLTAGTHTLHVEYRCTKTVGMRTCKLHWTGPMAREPIPASQLVPAAETPQPELDGWKVYAFGQDILNAVERLAPGVYRFASGKRGYSGARTGVDYLFMCQDWRGSFDISANFRTGYASTEGILMRDAEGNMYWVRLSRDASGVLRYGVWGMRPGETERRVVAEDTEVVGGFWHPTVPFCLRLVRDGASFTAFYRKKTAEDWTPFATWTDAAFPRAVAVGFMTCGNWGTEPFDVDVSEIALRLTRDPLLIIVR